MIRTSIKGMISTGLLLIHYLKTWTHVLITYLKARIKDKSLRILQILIMLVTKLIHIMTQTKAIIRPLKKPLYFKILHKSRSSKKLKSQKALKNPNRKKNMSDWKKIIKFTNKDWALQGMTLIISIEIVVMNLVFSVCVKYV